MKIIKLLTLIISISLFLISLTQKCFCTDNGCGDTIAVLFSGGLGFFLSMAGFTWVASPALFISWAALKNKPDTSPIFSAIATALSGSFRFFHTIVADESGGLTKITAYKCGYWLWLSSCIAMLTGSVIVYVLEDAKTITSPTGHN